MFSYENIKKIFFLFNPETVHNIVEFIFKYSAKIAPFIPSILAKRYFFADPRIEQKILGRTFLHPVGLAAGFDKNATMIPMLCALGFSHVEFGTVTPQPQAGNAKPRLFRFVAQKSIQNAMGFNNLGMKRIKQKVANIYPYAIPLGANIGKNKTTSEDEAFGDYALLIDTFKDLSDYIAINISSPNTPGLRNLQNESFLRDLLILAKEKTDKPIMLKIAPDLDIADAITLCKCAIDNGISGIIATNTTIDYTLLENAKDFGGISGKVLREKSFTLFEALAKEFYGKTTLISVGGIDDAKEAYKRIRAGASLVQVYSSFIFEGPAMIKEISKGILELMDRDGFFHISEAIGADRRIA